MNVSVEQLSGSPGAGDPGYHAIARHWSLLAISLGVARRIQAQGENSEQVIDKGGTGFDSGSFIRVPADPDSVRVSFLADYDKKVLRGFIRRYFSGIPVDIELLRGTIAD